MKTSTKIIKCTICNKQIASLGMPSHIKNRHKNLNGTKHYYDIYMKNNNEGICVVCGKETNFKSISVGYMKHCSLECGHKDSNTQYIRKQTCIHKYGVEYVTQNNEVKNKIKNSNIKTLTNKYGVTNNLSIPGMREKARRTILNKYGDKGVFGNEVIKAKIKEHTINVYGVNHISQSDYIKNRIKDTKYTNIESFCELNNCTLVSTVCSIYGNAWTQQKEFIDLFIYYKSRVFISNDNINRVKDYMSTSHKSNIELEVYQFVKEIDASTLHNSRNIINPLELDIFSINKRVAIEINGIYWHSNNKVDKNYHLNKTELCEEKDIQLIHIFENEWNTKQEICKSIITSSLNIYKKYIDANDCIVKTVDKNETNTFIIKNYLYNISHYKYTLGLYYNKELVQLLLIDNNVFTIVTKLNTYIKNGCTYLLEKQPNNTLYCYIDRSKFSKNIYGNLPLIDIIEPTKIYCTNDNRVIYELYNSGYFKLKYNR